jgi:hypothetical protein
MEIASAMNGSLPRNDNETRTHVCLPWGILLITAACFLAACSDGNGESDASLDADGVDAADQRPEICISHPNTCHTGSTVIDPYDCCTPPRQCCNLCFPPEGCGSRTECLETCPEVIPCGGIPDHDHVSCYYQPSQFEGTVYCPVDANPNPAAPLACAAVCETGVVCPMLDDRFGDAALCCPENWSCETVPLYNLPVCAEP